MNFHGNNAISPATRTTGRTLLLLSTTLLFSTMGWIDTAETSVVGLKIESNAFIPILQFLVVAALVSHLVQWNGDRVALKGWNVEGAQLGVSRIQASSKPKLYDLIRKMEDGDWENAKQLEEIKRELKQFNRGFSSLKGYALFYVWVWHGVVPLLAGLGTVVAGFYA